ncbi:MAG: 30S ribosomal protein S5 [Candidatus Woesearchaeota archaeon]
MRKITMSSKKQTEEKKTRQSGDAEQPPSENEPEAVIAPVVEEVKLEVEKDVITEIPEEEALEVPKEGVDIAAWQPKTSLGQKVKSGEITDIDQILDKGIKILEATVVDVLLPNMENDLLMIGQAKGKFGGGQRRVFKQTQKKTPEGNKPSFSCVAIVGNGNGYVGVGYGKSKDTVPAREKALRKAKLNIFKIARGCGSWQCGCKTPHSIPFAVEGKCGSIRIRLMPAPKGKGLCMEQETAKILRFAGIKDVWSKTDGNLRSTTNLIDAVVDALKKLNTTKIKAEHAERVAKIAGKVLTE